MKRIIFILICFATSVLTVNAQGIDSASVLPYTTDFSTSDGWQLNNGTIPNYWVIDSLDSGNALFVTNNGVSPIYAWDLRSAVSAEKFLKVGNADYIIISFDFKCGGKSFHDFLKMFLAPPAQTYEAGYIPSWSLASTSLYAADFHDCFDVTNKLGRIAAHALYLFAYDLPYLMQMGVSWYELRERIDDGNDRLAKLLMLHACGHPQGAGTGHAASFRAYATSQRMFHDVISSSLIFNVI